MSSTATNPPIDRPVHDRLAFPSLSAFTTALAARGTSAEVDFGWPWRSAGFGASYRAAWLTGTGELFVVRLGPGPRAGGVELIAHVPDVHVLDSMMEGWQQACGEFDSVRWLRARVATAHPLKRREGWGLRGPTAPRAPDRTLRRRPTGAESRFTPAGAGTTRDARGLAPLVAHRDLGVPPGP
jgi:hypothetical protein